MQLTFSDLFPFDRGLCHLRVYTSNDGALLGLAIDLDDNPGLSIVNGAEALASRVASVFGRQARLFLVFPSSRTTWTEVLDTEPAGRAQFRSDVPHSEVESLVGDRIVLPPPGPCTADILGGPRHPLLALIPPEEEERHLLADMQSVAVADLPWPHNPSRCAHSDRFNAIRTLYDDDFDGHIPAGAHFFLSLGQNDFDACDYHDHDWISIAAASVKLLDQLPPDADREQIANAVSNLLPNGSDQRELLYLFSDPIVWAPGETSIINGQHRSCALRASGAPECAVLTCGDSLYRAVCGDPCRAAQSVLAAYWVDRLRDS